MDIEFIGYIGTRLQSEIIQAQPPVLDPAHVEQAARIHEEGGFDRALVAFPGRGARSVGDPPSRPADSSPARIYRPEPRCQAIRDAGRLHRRAYRTACYHWRQRSELRQDGSHIGKDERYARTDEYLDIVRREWTSTKPFDHCGDYYHVEQAFLVVKSPQQPHIPVYFGGASDAAIHVAGKHADVYALWGETYAQVTELVGRVRTEAARHGRKIRFSLSLRPILADTEEKAWPRPRPFYNARGIWLSAMRFPQGAARKRRLSAPARCRGAGCAVGQTAMDRHRRVAGCSGKLHQSCGDTRASGGCPARLP
jgi:alkanesulfonate monooxygenase